MPNPNKPGPPAARGPGMAFPAQQGPSGYNLQIFGVTPNSDRIAGGQAVTISGGIFYNQSGSGWLAVPPDVFFNGIPATNVQVISFGAITCIVPAQTAPGLVDIRIVIRDKSHTLFGAFTYYAGDITSVTPASGLEAGGGTVIITGHNFLAGSTIKFGGVAATSVVFYDDQHFSCVVPAHAAGAVDVVITEPSLVTVTGSKLYQYIKYTRTLITRADIRRMPGIRIQDQLNNSPNSCTFTVDGGGARPKVGEAVQILDGVTVIFAGNVQSVEDLYESGGEIGQLLWNVTAIDYTTLLNRKRPFGTYDNVSVSEIVIDLVNRFAPGFTTAHVQTNLMKVSVTFDGTQDLVTCLSDLAQAIGGGHWKVDYTQDLHFFHAIPPEISPPDIPQAPLTAGPGSAMVAAAGAAIPARYPIGYYVFTGTFVYDNGVESNYWPLSNLVPLSGANQIVLSSIPIGPAISGHTVVKRRIYIGTGNPLLPEYYNTKQVTARAGYVEIQDNTTITFTSDFGAINATVGAVVAFPVTATVPPRPNIAPPAGPQNPVTINTVPGNNGIPPGFTGGATWPQFNQPNTVTPGFYEVKVAFLYRDGTISLPGPATPFFGFANDRFGTPEVRDSLGNLVTAATPDTAYPKLCSLLPIGPTINGVDVIARLIYGCYVPYISGVTQGTPTGDWQPGHTSLWYIVEDNTTTQTYIGPGTGTGLQPAVNPNDQDINPLWPNNDGPDLENTIPPDAINDSNTSMLRDPPFTQAEDLSQVRNRIYVRGIGTTLTVAASVLETKISVADASIFPQNGGSVLVGTYAVPYIGVDLTAGFNVIFLAKQLTIDIPQGAPVNVFMQVDDFTSQLALAQIETDVNGRPTDGVHEYMVSDPTLQTTFQLYMRGFAELELFGRPTRTIRYATRDTKTRAGSTVHVDLSNPRCAGDFLIQSVDIDQIGEDAETLTPRYTVTASSVRFNLEDLLLKILADKRSKDAGGSSITQAGVITAAVDQATASTLTNRMADMTRVWMIQFPITTGGTPDRYGMTNLMNEASGTFSTNLDPDGLRAFRKVTANSADPSQGFNAQYSMTTNFATLAMLPYMKVVIRTGSDLTGSRFWINFWDSTGINNQGNKDLRQGGALRNGYGLHFTTIAADGQPAGWVPFISNSNTGGTYGGTLFGIAPLTVYTVTIETLSLTQVKISVNGKSATMDLVGWAALLPTSNITPQIYLNSLTNTKTFDFGWLYVDRKTISTGF